MSPHRRGWPVPQLLRLPDGRELAWYEFGDPAGTPCLYTPGTPESGLAGGCYDAAARDAGIRWISVDKPGYGHSDPSPGRTFLDWPADVAALADRLGLSRFALAGESGGGAHALVAAHGLAGRTSVVVLLAAMGPADPGSLAGMRPTNVLLFRVAQLAPWLLLGPGLVMRRTALLGERVPRVAERLAAAAPAADREAMADPDYGLRRHAVADAFRGGTRPAAEELALFVRPWGFPLADLEVPVHLWHGTEDVNVPFRVAEQLALRLPRSTPHFVDGAAHLVGFQHRAEVMQVVRGSAAPPARRSPGDR